MGSFCAIDRAFPFVESTERIKLIQPFKTGNDSYLYLSNSARVTPLQQGARCLARALRANSTLKELDLRWNDVGGDGARALRDSLHTNRALISLKLSGNKVAII